MYEFPKPDKSQELLAKFEGAYRSEVKFYFAPDQPPMQSLGRFIAKIDLGGYFLDRELKVNLHDAGDFSALAFHGRSFTGYDPFVARYTGVWIDSGSPAVYHTEGYFDEPGNVFHETSIGPDPQGQPMKFRMTTEFGKDKLFFTMFRVNDDGSETLTTEIIHFKEI